MPSVYRPFDAVNAGRGNLMICYICEAKEKVVRLAGPYVSQRFNVCKKCLKKAMDLKAGEILEYIEEQ